MSQLKYRFIPEGQFYNIEVPVSIALVNYEDVEACGISNREACERIAAQHNGPIAINIWDLKHSVTTTSDGIMVDGSILATVTPPVGTVMFVICKKNDLTIGQYFKNMLPWFGMILVVCVIIACFPSITLFLPNLLL